MDFRAACYCYSQLLQLACYASRALIIFRFSRNFLGATVTCMLSLSSILLIQNRTNSLIQNRTNDFCASFAYLRAKHCICPRKALQSPTQSFASAPANVCWKRGLPVNLERSLHLGLLPHVFPTEPKLVHNAWTQERVRQIIRPYTSFSPSGEMVMSLRL